MYWCNFSSLVLFQSIQRTEPSAIAAKNVCGRGRIKRPPTITRSVIFFGAGTAAPPAFRSADTEVDAQYSRLHEGQRTIWPMASLATSNQRRTGT